MSHGDRVTRCPRLPVVAPRGAPFAAIADESAAIYGVQFHPEVVHTPDGGKLLANFVRHIAG
jgi:GMP synthase (glutamine-hydrolysing)